MKKASQLNDAQAEAVTTIHGPLLIFAGAGSGKTRVITHRIRYMVKKGIAPSSIVAVTFTNKSAKEMKGRLREMMDRKQMHGMVVSTFHSLGNRILKHEIHHLQGYRQPFSILSPDDALNIFADIYRSLKLDPTEVKNDSIAFLVSLAKNSGIAPDEYAERNGLKFPPAIFADIYHRYQHALISLNSVDFDDLILLPRRIFEQEPGILEKYRRRWKHFLVDEFQDTNPAQYALLKILVGSDRNVCVVGDDDQSIYGWRGADVNIILGFHRDYPQAKTIHLEMNYRSTGTILEAANAVIHNNLERVKKRLRATLGQGTKLKGMTGADEVREAQLVADEILRQTVQEKRTPGDFAILFRTNFQSRVFEQELRARNIPLHVVGGYRFFDRREVKDMISYLRYVANPHDEISLKRILNRPRRGIGESTIRKINEYILELDEENRVDFETVLRRMMEEPGLISGVKADTLAAIREFLELIEHYRKQFAQAVRLSPVLGGFIKELKWEMEFMRDGDNESAVRARMLNLQELANMMAYMQDNWEDSDKPTLFDFLAQVSMQAGDNDEEERSGRGRVQLLTLHLSKGLEFPVVFLTGIEEGIFPAPRAISESVDQERALAEERRLFYVGITRARQELFLTYSATRKRFGETMDVEPSRFLNELPGHLLEWIYTEGGGGPELSEEDAMDTLLSGLDSFRGE